MSIDDFQNQLISTSKLIEKANQDFNHIQLLQKQQKSVVQNESNLRNFIKKIDLQCIELVNIVKEWENNLKKYQITEKEVTRRKNQLNEIKSKLSNLKSNINKDRSSVNHEKNLFERRNLTETEDDESKKLTNQQIYENQKNVIKDQDEEIMNLLGNVLVIKTAGENINQALDEQVGLLQQLDKTVTANSSTYSRITSKLENVTKNTSNCCLISWITIEIMILLMIIIIL